MNRSLPRGVVDATSFPRLSLAQQQQEPASGAFAAPTDPDMEHCDR